MKKQPSVLFEVILVGVVRVSEDFGTKIQYQVDDHSGLAPIQVYKYVDEQVLLLFPSPPPIFPPPFSFSRPPPVELPAPRNYAFARTSMTSRIAHFSILSPF